MLSATTCGARHIIYIIHVSLLKLYIPLVSLAYKIPQV